MLGFWHIAPTQCRVQAKACCEATPGGDMRKRTSPTACRELRTHVFNMSERLSDGMWQHMFVRSLKAKTKWPAMKCDSMKAPLTELTKNMLGEVCLFPRQRATCKCDIFLRMAVWSTSAPDCCFHWCCTASIVWPFAVRIPSHHATIAHGWITHPRLTWDARTTALTLSSVQTRGSRLTWCTCSTVARWTRWTYGQGKFICLACSSRWVLKSFKDIHCTCRRDKKEQVKWTITSI